MRIASFANAIFIILIHNFNRIMKYYYLIAGSDLQPDNIKTAPTITALLEELDAALTPHDAELLRLLRMRCMTTTICWLTSKIKKQNLIRSARSLIPIGKNFLP